MNVDDRGMLQQAPGKPQIVIVFINGQHKSQYNMDFLQQKSSKLTLKNLPVSLHFVITIFCKEPMISGDGLSSVIANCIIMGFIAGMCVCVCVFDVIYIVCLYITTDICSIIKMPRYKSESLLVIIAGILHIKIKLYGMSISSPKTCKKNLKVIF